MERLKEMIQNKQKYKEYKENLDKLPAEYKTLMHEVEQYMWYYVGDHNFVDVLNETLSYLENGIKENKTMTELIGEDPVVFADNIIAKYPEEMWLERSKKRLREEIKKLNKHD